MPERWIWNERMKRSEKRPKDKCPHCRQYDFVTVRRFDGPGILWSTLAWVGLVEAGETTEVHTSICDNCGYSSGKRRVSDA